MDAERHFDQRNTDRSRLTGNSSASRVSRGFHSRLTIALRVYDARLSERSLGKPAARELQGPDIFRHAFEKAPAKVVIVDSRCDGKEALMRGLQDIPSGRVV